MDLIDYLDQKRVAFNQNESAIAKMLGLTIGTWMRYRHRERRIPPPVLWRIFRLYPKEQDAIFEAWGKTQGMT